MQTWMPADVGLQVWVEFIFHHSSRFPIQFIELAWIGSHHAVAMANGTLCGDKFSNEISWILVNNKIRNSNHAPITQKKFVGWPANSILDKNVTILCPSSVLPQTAEIWRVAAAVILSFCVFGCVVVFVTGHTFSLNILSHPLQVTKASKAAATDHMSVNCSLRSRFEP